MKISKILFINILLIISIILNLFFIINKYTDNNYSEYTTFIEDFNKFAKDKYKTIEIEVPIVSTDNKLINSRVDTEDKEGKNPRTTVFHIKNKKEYITSISISYSKDIDKKAMGNIFRIDNKSLIAENKDNISVPTLYNQSFTSKGKIISINTYPIVKNITDELENNMISENNKITNEIIEYIK